MGFKEKCWDAIYNKNEYIHNCSEEFSMLRNERKITQRLLEIAHMYKNYASYSTNSELKHTCSILGMNEESWKKEIDIHDIISFDIFDTLLFRPCFHSYDLFFFLEYENKIPDFRRMRVQAEIAARKKKEYEKVNIYDIYSVLSEWCQIDIDEGVNKELQMEEKLDFVNPYVLRMFQYAKEKEKRIIVTSDMYLPKQLLEELLQSKGIDGYENIYVSCDYGVTKWTGKLFECINKEYGDKSRLHIGDNKKADQSGAKKSGWDSILIQNVNRSHERMRGPITQNWMGSIYAGITDSYLYSGVNTELANPYFQYGFVYGGILTYGFCQWIHTMVERKNLDSVLFLSRDCRVVEQVYNQYFGGVENHYVKSSRISLLPYLSNYSLEIFVQEAFGLRIFSDKMSVRQALKDVGLGLLADKCEKEFIVCQKRGEHVWQSFRTVIANHMEEIRQIYQPNYIAFQQYMKECVGNRKRIGIIDVGWRGSSILYLKQYIEENFEGVTVYGGMMAYGSTPYTQTWAASGDIEGFIFSPSKEDPYHLNNGKIIYYTEKRLYLEYLFTDCGNSLLSYELDDNGEVAFRYEEKDVADNDAMILGIHRGIFAFSEYYHSILGDYAEKLTIGEKVAFNPMYRLLREEKCLKKMFQTYNEKKSTLHGYN